MKIEEFLEKLNVDFFTGVPDSRLKALCNYLMCKYKVDPKHHIIAANEGNAVAIAAGYHLATGKIPVVYMQNSGEGNTLNPLASLTNPEVYNIPMILIIGWRGQPGLKDEPQHVYQGKITTEFLEMMGIAYAEIDEGTQIKEIEKLMKKFNENLKNGKNVAFVVKEKGLEFNGKIKYKNSYKLSREKIVELVTQYSENDMIISTTGKASRELFEIREKNHENHNTDFLTVGSMGHASSIALGIAINKPNKKIWCIDGDGAALMHLGAMAVIGKYKPKNMIHVVVNNGAHETVGGMPTVFCNDESKKSISLADIALDCGYEKVFVAKTEKELEFALHEAKNATKLTFVEAYSAIGARKDLGRPTTTPIENKEAFMKKLQQ
ncbi:phosphonopyruvate decarboxylase [Lachnospiraceae bacterium C7]|nr:phosphonopyruvate decarboxylase [Lachnospiraceae bacterium C7]